MAIRAREGPERDNVRIAGCRTNPSVAMIPYLSCLFGKDVRSRNLAFEALASRREEKERVSEQTEIFGKMPGFRMERDRRAAVHRPCKTKRMPRVGARMDKVFGLGDV